VVFGLSWESGHSSWDIWGRRHQWEEEVNIWAKRRTFLGTPCPPHICGSLPQLVMTPKKWLVLPFFLFALCQVSAKCWMFLMNGWMNGLLMDFWGVWSWRK
jgi:hypothetical protein